MILLNTGASNCDAPQINADKCLGGYPSSTGVPNGRLANLFSTIAKSDVLQKRSQIRMIALKNTLGRIVTNVKIYTNTTESHVKLKIAAVAPALDVNQNPIFEAVMDGSSLPFQAELNYQEGVENAIQIPSLEDKQVIGIWILREIDLEKFPELTTDKQGEELALILEKAVQTGEEDVNLIISFD